jgi:hypothetical protein
VTSWLTLARTELLGRLQADATLGRLIATWYSWGAGLQQRYTVEPSACPFISVVPAALDAEEIANAANGYDQDIEVGVGTDGQDCAPLEEIVATVVDILLAARHDCLGLAAEGVAGVTIRSIRWDPRPSADGARVIWLASIQVRIAWMRLTTSGG